MATVFSNWQRFISQRDLTRKLASQLTVFEGAMVISGILLFGRVLLLLTRVA